MQFFGLTSDAGGPDDNADVVGGNHLLQLFTQILAVFTTDPARHATRLGIGRHQHQVAASQRNIGRQGSTLVAAFFFFDLDDQFLTFLYRIANRQLAFRSVWRTDGKNPGKFP